MPTSGTVGWRTLIAHNRGLAFPALIVASVLILVAPLPPRVMNLLLASNLAASVVILPTWQSAPDEVEITAGVGIAEPARQIESIEHMLKQPARADRMARLILGDRLTESFHPAAVPCF